MASTRRRPARGVWRRFGMLLVGSTTAAVLLTPVGGVSAAPLTSELRLTELSPISAQPGTTLRARGTFVTNRSLDNVVVRLEVGTTAFFSRSAIAEAAANPPFTSAVSGAEDDLRKVTRDEAERFSIALPADELPFFSSGVYPMRIVAVDTATGAELSATTTFLPWAPEGVVPQSRLLMFWPLVGTPVRDSTGTVVDESLASAVAPDGRLSTLVRSGVQTRATWVVDPALLDDASSLEQPSADQWLSSFTAAARTREVEALPYGDPDVAAASTAGRPGFLRQGQAKGDRVYQRLVGSTARSDLSWPADGAGDDQVIATSERAGDSLVLLNEENVPLVSPLAYTPSGRIAWEDPEVDLLLADAPASALVSSPADTVTDVLLARQRFLAETLLHALELPSDPRLLVIAPPRRWDPSQRWADELVSAIRRATWINQVSLDQAVRPGAPTAPRVEPTIPTASLDRQLPASMVLAAGQGLTDNRRLAAILTRPRQLSAPIDDALFTSVSTAWRADPLAAEASQAATLDRLSSQRSKVRIVSQGGTLGDDSGTFPVTIRNELDQTVRVQLGVTSTDQVRLRVEGPEDVIKIAADDSDLVEVELDATTSGRLSFDAQVLTPRGAAYDDPVTLVVDVRGFGQVTFVVFGAAIALLMVAAGIRVFRRIRAARRTAA